MDGLVGATLDADVPLDFTAGVMPEDDSGQATTGGETYVDEHERLLDADGAFFPEGVRAPYKEQRRHDGGRPRKRGDRAGQPRPL